MLNWRKTLSLTLRLRDVASIFLNYMEELMRANQREGVAVMRLAPTAILDLMWINASVNHQQLQLPTTQKRAKMDDCDY
jgi:hypothetical protein